MTGATQVLKGMSAACDMRPLTLVDASVFLGAFAQETYLDIQQEPVSWDHL